MTQNVTTLPEMLQFAITKCQLTKKEAAQLIGFSPSTLRRYLDGDIPNDEKYKEVCFFIDKLAPEVTPQFKKEYEQI